MPMVPMVFIRRFAGARIRSLVALAGAAAILGISARIVSSAAPLAAGPAAWTNDLSPITPADWSYERARHLLERAGFGGTPDDVARLAAMTPRQAVDSPRRFRGDPERSEAVRRIGHLGSRHGSVSAEPCRSRPPRARARRGARREDAARRFAAPAAAGRRQVLLQPGREQHRNAAPRSVVGESHARDEAAARREADALLARPLRDRREQGARLPDDAPAERDVPRERRRQPARRCWSAS